MKKKFDCYKCAHRGGVAGSTHSSCKNPLVQDEANDAMGNIMAIFASVGRGPAVIAGAEKLNIKGSPHGIKNGWFNWPYNFDPIWLENCDGFKKRIKT